MNILICGIDGYLGWPLALSLEAAGHKVSGIDAFYRRGWAESLTPIGPPERCERFKFHEHDMQRNFHPELLEDIDAVVHLAEMPSAPWSMISPQHSIFTHQNNVNGTLQLLWALKDFPHIHLVKLGTMGEYGTPKCKIPEGEIPIDCLGGYAYARITPYPTTATPMGPYPCPMANLPFPRSPGSFYHLTKVHDTHNIIFACKNWGLRCTDIMQGVVYGIENADGDSLTRFDYDEYFGTAINRFIAQSLAGMPITPYGVGNQIRGFLPLQDSLQCLRLVIENPPERGLYRVFNQFASTYTINQLAELVHRIARECCFPTTIKHIENPRNELEEHYYEPAREGLLKLGYQPNMDMETVVRDTINILAPFADRINREVIMPKTRWDGTQKECQNVR